MTSSPAYAPRGAPLLVRPEPAYAAPLSPSKRVGILALVIFFHVGGGWALTQIEPAKLTVGDMTSIEIRMVPAEVQAPINIDTPPPDDTPPPELEPVTLDQPPPEDTPPPEIEPVKLDTPPPDDTPPPEVPMLEAMVSPPTPDLPPPEFPVAAPPPPPPKPKPPPPPPKPRPQPAAPVTTAAPQTAPPVMPQAPKTVSIGQVTYINRPNPVYPASSRRAGEQGEVLMRVLVDGTGRPAQVLLIKSSGYPALDESALSAMRATSFRPYSEGGVTQPVWVNASIGFVFQR